MGGPYNVIIVGAGTAGLPAAIFAARRGARVLVVEAADKIGGTLHLSSGQMSAAGTKLQKRKGVIDTPDAHYADIMRITHNTANAEIVRLAVDNAAALYDWLEDNGLVALDEHPVLGMGHEPYTERRYAWGADGGRSVLKVLEGPFWQEVAAGRIDLRLQTYATGLVQDRGGAVTGLRIRNRHGVEEVVAGDNVVLASGGYGSNPALYQRLNGVPQYLAESYPYSQGQGLLMGEAAGGWLRGAEHYYSYFGAILHSTQQPSPILARCKTQPELRQPWEIYVNAHGERFIAEDTPSIDAREKALLRQPELRFWIVFDQAIADAAPPLVNDWSKEKMLGHMNQHPMFLRAGTVADLAQAMGVPAAALARTIEQYNTGLNRPDPLGRRHRPLPLVQAPYYALRLQGGLHTATVGLAVDGQLRVIDRQGKPIPNLYAAGEMIGGSQTTGNAPTGGMMVTPALTFGRLLGHRLLTWPGAAAAE